MAIQRLDYEVLFLDPTPVVFDSFGVAFEGIDNKTTAVIRGSIQPSPTVLLFY